MYTFYISIYHTINISIDLTRDGYCKTDNRDQGVYTVGLTEAAVFFIFIYDIGFLDTIDNSKTNSRN